MPGFTGSSSGSTETSVGPTLSCRPDADKTALKVREIYSFKWLMFNSNCSDVEREERQINYYKNKLEAAETKMRDYDRCFNDTEGSDLIKKLIDEKESQTIKIFQMSEKLKMMEEREERLKSEVQDAKDQAELLEFRVLELEECQEKVNLLIPIDKQKLQFKHLCILQTRFGKNGEKDKQDIGTETECDLIDSGCSSLRHSRCSSVTTELEDGHHGQESKSDFGVSACILLNQTAGFTTSHHLISQSSV